MVEKKPEILNQYGQVINQNKNPDIDRKTLASTTRTINKNIRDSDSITLSGINNQDEKSTYKALRTKDRSNFFRL